jgi:hypothetical protein
MRNGHFSNSWSDNDGNDVGGTAVGLGFTIAWQNGPLGRGIEKKKPNGAFVEDVLDACIRRLAVYQKGKFACVENANAMQAIEQALTSLDERTKEREERDVEGTNEV